MADPFVAEIRIFPFTFAPRGWAWCNGQLMPISQNTALFSLLGTTYGGDGKSTFALPNLQGSAPMHPGQGQGLSLHDLGEQSGTETVTLLESEIPGHSHGLMCNAAPGNRTTPVGGAIARTPTSDPPKTPYAPAAPPSAQLNGQALAPAGGDQPHNNMQPYLTFNFNIAVQGVFPQRP
jgi:microcystin-dependent protein